MSIFSQSEDKEEIRLSLNEWLKRKYGASYEKITSIESPGDANGYSNETYKLEVVFQDRIERLILRLPPKHVSLFPTYDLSRQHDFMAFLNGKMAMPALYAFEADCSLLGRPFFLMEFVDGQIPSDNPPYIERGWVCDASEEQRRRLWTSTLDSIIAISHVKPDAAFLRKFDWNSAQGTRLDQLLRYYDGLYRWVSDEMPSFKFPLLEELGNWLIGNQPPEELPRIVWGDARPGNIIYRDFEPVALLDWELAYIGDPSEELTWFLTMQRYYERKAILDGTFTGRLSGFLDDGQTLEYYNRNAVRPISNVRYFWLLSAYRSMCMSQRFSIMLHESGVIDYSEAMRMRKCPYLYDDIEAVLGDERHDALFV